MPKTSRSAKVNADPEVSPRPGSNPAVPAPLVPSSQKRGDSPASNAEEASKQKASDQLLSTTAESMSIARRDIFTTTGRNAARNVPEANINQRWAKTIASNAPDLHQRILKALQTFHSARITNVEDTKEPT